MYEVVSMPTKGFVRSEIRRLMEEKEIDYVVLTSPQNVYYTTGYTCLPSSDNPILHTLRNQFPFASIINRQGSVSLVCWGFSTVGVQFGVDEVLGFDSYEEALRTFQELFTRWARSGAVIGVESSCPWFLSDLWNRVGGTATQWELVDDLMMGLRVVKSPEELDLVRRSTAIAEQTLGEVLGSLRIGMSRLDLMQEARYRVFRNGGTGLSHLTMSFGTANPEIGIGELLQPDRLVTLDVGAVYYGYCSDIRRYAYTGSVPKGLELRFRTMVNIVDQVGESLEAGRTYADLYQMALRLHEQADITPMFNHVGHNMGLDTEEEWLVNSHELVVRDSSAITIELYSVEPNVGSIGDEENYEIIHGKPQRISKLPRVITTVG